MWVEVVNEVIAVHKKSYDLKKNLTTQNTTTQFSGHKHSECCKGCNEGEDS